jgi:hypothetical protein
MYRDHHLQLSWKNEGERALLALIILAGTALRVYRLGAKGFWGDEIWTAGRNGRTASQIVNFSLDNTVGPRTYLRKAAGSARVWGLAGSCAALGLASALVVLRTIAVGQINTKNPSDVLDPVLEGWLNGLVEILATLVTHFGADGWSRWFFLALTFLGVLALAKGRHWRQLTLLAPPLILALQSGTKQVWLLGETNASWINFAKIRQPNWTDHAYSDIEPGGALRFSLSMPGEAPRELWATYFDFPHKEIEASIDGQVVGVIGGAKADWQTARFLVAEGVGDIVDVTTKAVGADTSGISHAELRAATQ